METENTESNNVLSVEFFEQDNAPTSVPLKDTVKFNPDNFNIAFPFSPKIFFTVRGAENFHIYLWICKVWMHAINSGFTESCQEPFDSLIKDLGWTQDWKVWSMFFGTSAVAWLFVLTYHAVKARCYEEVYMLIALTLWLFGNYWWMVGEELNDDDAINAPETNHMVWNDYRIAFCVHI